MLLAINKQVLRLWILLGSALVNFGFSYTALQLGYGITGVAAGTSLAYFVFFLTSSVIAMRYAQASHKESCRLLVKVLGPMLYIGAVIALVTALIPVHLGPLRLMIKWTVIREMILITSSSYLIYRVFQGGLVPSIFRRT